MTKVKFHEYTPQKYNVEGLEGLDPEMLKQHLGLYEGYVTNTNKANAALAKMFEEGTQDAYAFAETRRRLGFEYSGMRLHELYFEVLKPGGKPAPQALTQAVSAQWGSFDTWVADVVRTGTMRGIGWSITYQDPKTKALQNFWINDHENLHPAGLTPIFILDVWEHAYVKQFGAGGRKDYINAFLKHVDWEMVAKRLA